MHPFLVCLAVVFLSEFLECFSGDIISDISDECVGGRNISTYLTTGMGTSDLFVGMIAKEGVNCTVSFIVHTGNYIVLVLQFLDWTPGKSQCGSEDNKVKVMVRNEEIDICLEVKDHIFKKVAQTEVSVLIEGGKDLQTIKITATSLKASTHGKCNELEVICVYEDVLYCMTEETKCDGHLNCGVQDRYDENPSYCTKYYSVNPGMIIGGLVIVSVTFCMMVTLLRKLVPNREGTFKVKEDETLSEKDRMTSEMDYQVKIKIVYDQEINQQNLDEFEGVAQENTIHRRLSNWKMRKGRQS